MYYDCSDRNPCGYGDGECSSDGDCDTEYKCGVNNCGSFVAGQAGSCCVVLTNTTVSPAVSTERAPHSGPTGGPGPPPPRTGADSEVESSGRDTTVRGVTSHSRSDIR